jgi:hypothetical protein
MRIHLFIITIVALTNCWSAFAQSEIDSLLGPTTEETHYTTATFKSTRVINGHSIERMQAKQLDFRISHRFGEMNSGAYGFWGMDQANIHLSLEYGITDWLMAGIGRGNYEKSYDGFMKFSILRQSSGKRNMPISLSWFSSVAVNTLKFPNDGKTHYNSSRFSYVNQALIARKFNESFSLQLMPTYVHRNYVATETDYNDLVAMGIGGRYKLTKRISFNAEYYYVHKPKYPSVTTYNPLSFGFDIETGGHVFQIMVTNSVAMIEKGFIGETTGNWAKGGAHLGFNISRVFSFK